MPRGSWIDGIMRVASISLAPGFSTYLAYNCKVPSAVAVAMIGSVSVTGFDMIYLGCVSTGRYGTLIITKHARMAQAVWHIIYYIVGWWGTRWGNQGNSSRYGGMV